MPSLNSIADVRVDAEKLVLAVEANTESLPDADFVKAPLVASLARLKDMTTRRDTLKVDSQVLSKDIQELLRLMRDQSSGLRGLVKARFGVRSEKLKEFLVVPNRLGVRRKSGSGALKRAGSTTLVGPAPTALPSASPVTG